MDIVCPRVSEWRGSFAGGDLHRGQRIDAVGDEEINVTGVILDFEVGYVV